MGYSKSAIFSISLHHEANRVSSQRGSQRQHVHKPGSQYDADAELSDKLQETASTSAASFDVDTDVDAGIDSFLLSTSTSTPTSIL